MQYGNKCKLCWKVSVYYNFLQYHCNVSSNGKKKKKYVGGTTKFTFHTFQNRFIIYLLKIV